MPTNLPPDAKNKWAEVEAARHPKQKLQKMQEFLRYVPKHKGTMKLRGQIKKKMAVLRKEMEEHKAKRSTRGGPKLFIEKEGSAQVALLGMTKAGKSCLLSVLTNANVLVSAAPYATRSPVPSIMNFEDVQLQVVEAPALMEGSASGRAWGLQTLAIARNADGLILMLDLAGDPVAQLNLILKGEEPVILMEQAATINANKYEATIDGMAAGTFYVDETRQLIAADLPGGVHAELLVNVDE